MDRNRAPRARMLAAIAVVAVTAYLTLLAGTFLLDEEPEQVFGVPADTPGSLHVYVETMTIEAARQSARLRLSFAPDPSMRGLRMGSARHDVTVLLDDGDAVQEVLFRANEPMQPLEINADFVAGSVFTYPFDRYLMRLRLRAIAAVPPAPGSAPGAALLPIALPVALTMWSDAGGFAVHARRMAAESDAIRVELQVRRRLVLAWYAILAYAAMMALAVSALLLGSLVFLGRRKAEATLVGAVAAITFTLLALRNTLPGAPPFGVLPDLLVFLWVEMAAVIGLALAVVAWVREGPPPN